MCDNPMRFRQGAIAAGGPITVDVRSAVVPSEGDAQTPRYATLRLAGYHQIRVRDTGRAENRGPAAACSPTVAGRWVVVYIVCAFTRF